MFLTRFPQVLIAATVTTFLLCSSLTRGSAQDLNKRKIYWQAYLQMRGLSEDEILNIAVINAALDENLQYPPDSLLALFKRFRESFNRERDATGLPTLRALNIMRPVPGLTSNPFAAAFSRMVLKEWYGQSKRRYQNAAQKYTDYIPDNSERENFDIPITPLIEEMWDLYLKKPAYRELQKKVMSLEIWPDDPFDPEDSSYLSNDAFTVTLVKNISDNGKLKISGDSLNNLARELSDKYNEAFAMSRWQPDKKPAGMSDDTYNKLLERERAREEKLIKQFNAANDILAQMLGKFNPDDAAKMKMVFSNTARMYDSWSKWKSEYFKIQDDAEDAELKKVVSILSLGNGVAGAAMGIYNAFSQSGKKAPEAYIMKQLQALERKIDTLSKQMHERFDIVDTKLNLLFESMNKNFRSMMFQLQEINYITSQTRADIIDTRRQMLRIEADVISYLQTLSNQNFRQKLSYYLDYKLNFPGSSPGKDELKNAFHEFGFWGTDQAKSNLFAGDLSGYSMQDRDISADLRKFSRAEGLDLNYFIYFTRSRFGKDYFNYSSRKSNRNLWAIGSESYMELANEWQDIYKKNLSATILNQLIDNGEELRVAGRNILYLNGKTDSAFFGKLVAFQRSRLNALKGAYAQTLSGYIKENNFDSDPDFSIWKVNRLSRYSFPVPARMSYSDTVSLDLKIYVPQHMVQNNRQMTAVNVGEGLAWNRFRPDTINIVKYAHLLGLGDLNLSYKYWEGIGTSPAFSGPPIDTQPGSLYFGSRTDMITGIMSIQGTIGKHAFYKISRTLGLIYYRTKSGPPYVYASGMATPGSSGFISYSAGRKNHADLFRDIWMDARIKSYWDLNVKYDHFDTAPPLRRIRTDVEWELLRHQTRLYRKLVDEQANEDAVYSAVNGSKDILRAFFQLSTPSLFETSDSLRSFFYGMHQIMDKDRFLAVAREFAVTTDSIISLRQRYAGQEHIDSTINRIKSVVKNTAFVKKYYSYSITKDGERDFSFSWNEHLFETALADIQKFESHVRKILKTIDLNRTQIYYPTVDPLLSKLYHFRFLYHGY